LFPNELCDKLKELFSGMPYQPWAYKSVYGKRFEIRSFGADIFIYLLYDDVPDYYKEMRRLRHLQAFVLRQLNKFLREAYY